MKTTGRLNQVNSEDRLVKILERCPGFVKARWQSRVQEIRSEDREPNIEDVRKLVSRVAMEKMIQCLEQLWMLELEIVQRGLREADRTH